MYCHFAVGVAKVAELERLLITTYSPALIKEYVHKLLGKVPERQLMFLTDKVRGRPCLIVNVTRLVQDHAVAVLLMM